MIVKVFIISIYRQVRHCYCSSTDTLWRHSTRHYFHGIRAEPIRALATPPVRAAFSLYLVFWKFLEVFVKKYGVKPSEALYIGDSEIDYLTAKNAGISCVLLNYGYDKPFLARKEFTAKLIDEFKEILNLL